jgi:hypothetical protein
MCELEIDPATVVPATHGNADESMPLHAPTLRALDALLCQSS